MREHNHSYTILILNIREQKLDAVEVNHCIICGEEKDE